MAYWLVKSEPESWSWSDQLRDKRTNWNGVRNHQAANNLKAMKKGDRAFFYHSGEERRIVGVVEVVKEHYPDPSDTSGRFVMVDVKAVKPLARPVTLAEMRSEPKLADFLLLRHSRLSVVPVSAAHWKLLCKLGETEA